MKMFARNPMIIEAVQWTGHNEAEVKELAGEAFQAVLKCADDQDQCPTCGENMDITGELTLKTEGTADEEPEEYTQGVETNWWIIRLPDERLSCLPDSTLRYNYSEITYAGSD